MFKKVVVINAFLLCGIAIFAQTTQDNEQLKLPDVTTVIDSESLKANNDALPDFNSVLEISRESGTVSVQLPDVDNQDTQVEVKTEKENSEKLIFAEGMIGGGYPFLFAGDFSVFRQTGNDPFKIVFNHESAAGYAGHALNDGYFDSSTSMELQKTLTRNNFEWNVEGAYKQSENGLQNLGEGVSSISQNTIGGKTDFLWTLPKGNSLGLSVSAKDYIRYANASSTENLEPWVIQTQVFSVLPVAWYSWEGYGFKTGVTADYSLDVFNGAVNRASFIGNFSWENKYVKLYTDAGVAASTKMNAKVAVPFTVGVASSIPVKFATRNIGLDAEFGIASNRVDIADCESNYKFAGFDSLAGENSYWYGQLDFVLPVKNGFTTSLNVLYQNVLFGHGFYHPDYRSEVITNGLYGYIQNDMERLYANLEFSYFYKIFATSFSIYGNFIDQLPLEPFLGCNLNLSCSDQKGKWGVEGSFNFKLSDVPALNLNGFVRISSAAKLVLQFDDIVYMVNPHIVRNYGYHETTILSGPGYTQYLDRNGSVTLALKFNF